MSKPMILCALVAVAGITALAAREASASYEEPAYKVLRRQGTVEVRDYPQLIAAEVTVDGHSNAQNEAFRILAGYIFGKNVAKQKIAMTVPVTESAKSEKIAMTVPVTESVAANAMTMRFFMPSKYSMESLPEAIDKSIKFKSIDPAKYAVIRFSGFPSAENVKKNTRDLLSFVSESGLKAKGDPIRAFYNPPWTLPFLRRNEIWIQLSSD